MKKSYIQRVCILLAIITLNVSCDQVSKNMARVKLPYYERVNVISDFLTLIKVENTGAFLSIGNNLPSLVKIGLLSVLPVLILGIATYYLFKNTQLSHWQSVGIAFVIGGGIGNLYDRIIHGSVTDFLHIQYEFLQTGIFNMADVSITVGMLLIFASLLDTRQRLFKS